MRILKYVTLAVILLAGLVSEAPSTKAAPFQIFAGGGQGTGLFGQGLVQKVHGCHHYRLYGNIYQRRFFQWRYPVWHKHLQDCAPVPARPPINRGIIYRDGYGYYCHPEWRRHRHPGFGKTWHQHAGWECYVTQGWEWKGGPRRGCNNVGGKWICR